MTDRAGPYDLTAIRKLLLTALDAQELHGDSLPSMVYKAVSYCERHDLLRELLARVEEKNPRQYAIVEADV